MEPTHVIFTGLVRNLDLFIKSLEDFSKLRSENMIGDIIFSTWVGEIDKYDGLRNTLEKYDCHLVESEPPAKSIGFIWHQMKSLYLGLEQVEDNLYCLKTRPDLYIKPEFIRKLIGNTDDLNINLPNEQEPIFEKKIWIPYFEITKPFYMSDECFWGKAVDLKKLVNFDASYDVLYDINCGIAHIRRFIHPFVERTPILREYLKYAAYSGHFTPFRFEILEYNLKSDFYLCCLAAYYKILHNYFRIESDYVQEQFVFRYNLLNPTVPLNEDEFISNFTPEKAWHPKGGNIHAHNETWLNNLFNHEMQPDDYLDRLYKYIDGPEKHFMDLKEELETYKSFMGDYIKSKGLIKPIPQEPSLTERIIRRLVYTITRQVPTS